MLLSCFLFPYLENFPLSQKLGEEIYFVKPMAHPQNTVITGGKLFFSRLNLFNSSPIHYKWVKYKSIESLIECLGHREPKISFYCVITIWMVKMVGNHLLFLFIWDFSDGTLGKTPRTFTPLAWVEQWVWAAGPSLNLKASEYCPVAVEGSALKSFLQELSHF